jgi:putative transposase
MAAGISTTSAHGLWREEGLRVPYRNEQKPHRGVGVAGGAMCPNRPNVLWALGFQFDTTVDGRTLKLLNIVDEYTRECPAISAGRHFDTDRVVA